MSEALVHTRPATTAARGSAMLGSAFVAVGAGNYAFSVALAYALSSGGYGVVALVQSFLLFAAWFTSSGLPWTAARRLAQVDDPADRAAVLKGAIVGNLVIATGLAAVLVALLGAGTLRLGDESGAPLLLGALACSLSGVNAAAKGGLQGLFRFRTVAIANLLEIAVKIGVGVGLAAAGAGPTGAAAGILAGMVVATVFTLVALRDVRLLRSHGFGGIALMRETVPLFAGTAGMALLTSIDLFAVKILSPESRSNSYTGFYQAAVTLARIPYFFASALTTAVFPYVARTSDDRAAAGLYVRKGALFTVVLLAPISLAMVVAPDAVLGALFPAAYAPAAAALRTIAVGTTALALAAFLVGALQAAGRDRLPAIAVLVAVAVEVVGLGLGIPVAADRGGSAELVVAGVAFDVAAFGIALTLWIVAWRTFAWRPRPRGAVAFVVAAAGFAFTLNALPHSGRASLALAAAAAAAVYAALAIGLGALSRGDLRTLRSGVPGLVRSANADRVERDGVSVLCHRGDGAIDSASPAWTALLVTAPRTRAFSRPVWARAWWHTYGRGREMRILEIREQGVPVALVALQISTTPLLGRRRLEFLGGGPGRWSQWLANPGDLGFAYFNDILVAPGHEDQALRGLRAWLEAARDEWDDIRLTSIPAESVLARRGDELLAGWIPEVTQQTRFYLDTSAGWDAYKATLSQRRRRHLRYEPSALSRAAGGELSVDTVRGAAAVEAMEEFISLHGRRWAQARRPGLKPGEAALYRHIAAGAADLVVVHRLRAADRTLAMQWGFDDSDRYLPYNFAFEPEFDRRSPSNVLIQLLIEACCRDGHSEIDFSGLETAGHWTCATRTRVHLRASATRGLSRWRAAAAAGAGEVVQGIHRSRPGQQLRRTAASAVAMLRRGPAARTPSGGTPPPEE